MGFGSNAVRFRVSGLRVQRSRLGVQGPGRRL